MNGFKEEFWEFRYYEMLIQVKTLGGLKRLGELCELNGYNKKILRDNISSYLPGNSNMINMVMHKDYPIIHFTNNSRSRAYDDFEEQHYKPAIIWYSTSHFEKSFKDEHKNKILAVFEDVENLDDEAFQLWKELN
jgi:hypothetical protein